jgi:hypothetical protein
MKRFSFATGLVCSITLATAVTAQTASSSTSTQARGEVQTGRTKTSAETKQETNIQIQRKGRTAEAKTDAQAQNSSNLKAGDSSLNLEAGTQLQAVLKNTLDSKQAEEGQQFLLKTTKDVKAGGQRVIKKGSTLVGHVVRAQSKAEGSGQAGMTLMIDGIQQDNQIIPLQAVFVGMIQQTAQTAFDSDLSSPMPSPSAPQRSSGGGLLGGGGLVGGATGAVNSTLGATTQTVGSVAGNTAGAGGALSSTTNGTLAATSSATNAGLLNEPGRVLFNLQNGLTATTSSTASGATDFSRAGKEIKLEKGTEFVLAITGQTQAAARTSR